MGFWSALFFAIALSLDGFGVGVAYGVQKLVLPVKARAMISVVSFSAITAALHCGGFIGSLLPGEYATALGRLILLVIGLWFLFQAWVKKKEKSVTEQNLPLAEFSLKSLGIVILVLRHPSAADFDRSGSINTKEAVFLGMALAMDAAGAGVGASIGASWPWYTSLLVGLSKFTFLSTGLAFGRIYHKQQAQKRAYPGLAYLPGLILCFLAISGF
ncbi:MAG TPA: sporulation membrane protein YtaF [Bacillota bacterium]